MADQARPDLRLKPILKDAWVLYRRLFGRTIVAATAVFASLQLLEAFAVTRTDTETMLALLAVSFALSIVATQLVQGGLAQAVGDLHEGRAPPRSADLYARTRPRLGALSAAAAITSVVGLAGTLLFVVPGLVVFTRWSLAVPLIVFENASPREALRRSNSLVRGRTWPVLRLVLTIFVSAGLMGAMLNLFFSGLPPFWAAWIGGAAAGALTMPFVAHALTVVYYRVTHPGRPVLPEPTRAWDSAADQGRVAAQGKTR